MADRIVPRTFITSYIGYVFELTDNGDNSDFMPVSIPENHTDSSMIFKTAMHLMKNAYHIFKLIRNAELLITNPNWLEETNEKHLERAIDAFQIIRTQPWWDVDELTPGLLDRIRREEQKTIKKLDKSKSVDIRQPRKPARKDGYVYLLKSKDGLFKIGYSSNPDDRIRTFDNKLPFKVHYHCLIQSDDMRALEKELHERFAHRNVGGEWFKLSPADVLYIENLSQGRSVEQMEQLMENDILSLPLFKKGV